MDVTAPSGPITVAKLAGSLANLVFWVRHPDLEGQALRPSTKVADEWTQIMPSHDALVALKKHHEIAEAIRRSQAC
jgi:hypothetical protein